MRKVENSPSQCMTLDREFQRINSPPFLSRFLPPRLKAAAWVFGSFSKSLRRMVERLKCSMRLAGGRYSPCICRCKGKRTEMDKSRIKILVVDDERGLCAGIQEALKREGYIVNAANDGPTALKMIGERLYNLVVTDMKMPEMSGLKLLKETKQKSRDTQFILMTAYGTVESAVEAMKEGAYDFLSKPLDMQRLRALVLKALEFQALVAENNELRLRLQKRSEPSLLVGGSETMRKVTELSDEVARSEVTVLIEGESGTGKEIVARSIHLKSNRADRPFISVNCAALPEQLLEAELFGHVKGAFTG